MKVVVIGGGVVGLCSAYSLRKRGYEVTVVDPGEGPSTSTINAGMIVPSHIIPLAAPGMVGVGLRMMLRPRSPLRIRPRLDPDLLRWMLRFARSCTSAHVSRSKKLLMELNCASKAAYLDFEREIGGFHVEQRGLLMIAKTSAVLDEESQVAAQVRELGLPAEVLDPHRLSEVDSTIQIDAAGAVHYPADCHFSPDQFIVSLRRKLESMEVEFRSTTVRHFTGEGVATDDGEIRGEVIVLAAGSWSAVLARRIGLRLPLQAGKGYSFVVDRPPARPSLPAILMEGRVAVTPMPNGAVRFGGTMEIGPPDTRIDERRVRGIQEAIPRYYPAFKGFDLSGHQVSLGLRPCSPDGLPYIGRTRRRENLIVATGHAMMGMSLGPITGRLVASLVAGETPAFDISALSPDRF